MRISVWLVLAALEIPLFFASFAFAQASAAPNQPGAKTVRDYSKGFEKFAALGLPDIKKASWVNLESSASSYSLFFLGRHGMKLKGNAWLLETKPDGRGLFVTADGRTVEVGEFKQHEHVANIGRWSPADLNADAKVLLGFLEKPVGEKRSDRYQLDAGGWGQLFLCAVCFHQKGLKTEANQIAARLFQQAGDSRKVIQQAVRLLADGQYNTAFDAFKASANWAQFGKDLEGLLERIPDWRNRPAIQRLTDAVKKRLATREPPPVEGADLADEDRKLARELAGLKQADVDEFSMIFHGSEMWVLGQSRGARGPAGDKSVLGRTTARKVKAFPLLIAMLKDDYLVAVDLAGSHSYSYSFSSSSEEEVMDEEKIQEIYDRMPRPATRSEIARALLKPIVSESQDRYRSDSDTDAIRQQALDWYNRHKSKTEGELVRYYLEQGRKEERRAAVEALIRSNHPEDRQVIEKHFLESKDVAEEVDMVTLYAEHHGEGAREFVGKYLARIKANPALLQPATPDDLRMSDQTRKYRQRQAKQAVATLEQLVSSKSAEALLEESLNSKQKWTEAAWATSGASLIRKLADEKPSKSLGLLLDAAVKAQDTFLVGEFLKMIMMLPHLRAYQANFTCGRVGVAWAELAQYSKLNFDMTAHAGAWRKLLADTRPLAEVETLTMSGQATVGQIASAAAERLFATGGDDPSEESTQLQLLGNKVYEVYRARAEARLAGKPESALPPFPSGKNVSAERRKTIQTELTAASGESLRQRVATLTSDEYLALHEIVAAEAQLNAKLAALANGVSDVQVTLDAPALKQRMEALKGKPLDRKMIETLVEAAKTLLKEGKPAQISISRDACLGGIKIRVEKPGAIANMLRQPGVAGLNKAMLMAYVNTSSHSETSRGYAMWLVDLPARIAPAAKKSKTGDDADKLDQDILNVIGRQDETFWKSLETVCAPKFNVCEALSIMMTGTIPDPNQTDEDTSPAEITTIIR